MRGLVPSNGDQLAAARVQSERMDEPMPDCLGEHLVARIKPLGL